LAAFTRLSFGAFTLDTEMRLLLRGAGAEPVHVSPKAYELTAPTPLADGNRIRIGLCELTFRTLAGQAATQTLG
jgi:hypothetical protein